MMKTVKKYTYFVPAAVLLLSVLLLASCQSGIEPIVIEKPEINDISPNDEAQNTEHGIRLNISEYSLTEGEVMRLSALITPFDPDAVPVWSSSDEELAHVDSDGRVKAKHAGEVIITATAGEKSASCRVSIARASVEVVHVTSIEIDHDPETEYKLKFGKTEQIKAKVYPENADDTRVIWTVTNPRVATVDENGLVTCIGNGNTTIIATTADGGKEASCHFNMRVPVTGASIDKHSLTLKVGDTAKLVGNVVPYTEGENWKSATDRHKVWASTDESVATISSGKVTAVGEGHAYITIMSVEGSFYDICEVNVVAKKLYAASADFTESELTLSVGATYSPELLQYDADGALIEGALMTKIAYSSADKQIATFDDGKITAVSAGDVIIRVSDSKGKKIKECTVHVVEDVFPLEKIHLPESASVTTGDFIRLVPSFEPYNADVSGLKWSSSKKKVAKVYDGGVVLAIAAGKTTISLSDESGKIYAECQLEVSDPVVKEKDEPKVFTLTLIAGEKKFLDICSLDEDALGGGELLYSSSDKNVVTIDTDGNMEATGEGNAVIVVVSADDGDGYSAKIEVTVLAGDQGQDQDQEQDTSEEAEEE